MPVYPGMNKRRSAEGIKFPVAFSMLLLASCGFPRPGNIGADSGAAVHDAAPDNALDTAIDAPDLPGTTVHVSNAGNDDNDGLAMPVKTIKRAIGIADVDPDITKVAIAAGRYEAVTGESFPYTVPVNVSIVGPPGGGAVLVGTMTEPGLVLDAGTLSNLELESFTVAMTARGMGTIANVRVRASSVALRAETTARLTLDGLDVTGSPGACALGIELNGNAQLTGKTLNARALGTSLQLNDQSTTSLSDIAITSGSCSGSVVSIRTNHALTLSDVTLDGGGVGISISPSQNGSMPHLQFSNIVIRDMKIGGLGAENALVDITGGEISSNDSGVAITGGISNINNMVIKNNPHGGVYVQDSSIVMHGCTIIGNSVGIDLSRSAIAELGTATNPGNNIFQNTMMGLLVEAFPDPGSVNAVGNIWQPSRQDADFQGRYSSQIVIGPVAFVAGNNFTIQNSSWAIQL